MYEFSFLARTPYFLVYIPLLFEQFAPLKQKGYKEEKCNYNCTFPLYNLFVSVVQIAQKAKVYKPKNKGFGLKKKTHTLGSCELLTGFFKCQVLK